MLPDEKTFLRLYDENSLPVKPNHKFFHSAPRRLSKMGWHESPDRHSCIAERQRRFHLFSQITVRSRSRSKQYFKDTNTTNMPKILSMASHRGRLDWADARIPAVRGIVGRQPRHRQDDLLSLRLPILSQLPRRPPAFRTLRMPSLSSGGVIRNPYGTVQVLSCVPSSATGVWKKPQIRQFFPGARLTPVDTTTTNSASLPEPTKKNTLSVEHWSFSPLGLEVLDPLVPSRRLPWSSWSPVFTWYRSTAVKETVQEAEDSTEDDDLEAEEILGQSDQSDESKIQNFVLDEPGMASDLLNEI